MIAPIADAPQLFPDLKVLVFGLGSFGGGAGAARFFASRGAHVTVTDRQSETQLRNSISSLSDVEIQNWRLGGHDPSDFEEADWIVVNPAVPPAHPLLEKARLRGCRLVTEIGLFLEWCPTAHVAGISGSNGKSTTTQLAHDMLAASGLTVHLGGNIGRSLLPQLASITSDDRVVLELSSFQLSRLGSAPRPRVVALTGLSSNHLDWHGSFAEYRRAKDELLRSAHVNDAIALIPAQSEERQRWQKLSTDAHRRVVTFAADAESADAAHADPSSEHIVFENGALELSSQLSVRADSLPLSGAAQRANIACATGVARALGATPEGTLEALQNFRALPHRQELVRKVTAFAL